MLLDSAAHEMAMWIDKEICRDHPNLNVLEPCRVVEILRFLGRKKAVWITRDDRGHRVWAITDGMARQIGVSDLRLPIRSVDLEIAGNGSRRNLAAVVRVLKKEFESPERFDECVAFAQQTFTAIRIVLNQIR